MGKKSKGLKLAYKVTFSYVLYHVCMVLLILFFMDKEIARIEKSFEEQYRKNAQESILNLEERSLKQRGSG